MLYLFNLSFQLFVKGYGTFVSRVGQNWIAKFPSPGSPTGVRSTVPIYSYTHPLYRQQKVSVVFLTYRTNSTIITIASSGFGHNGRNKERNTTQTKTSTATVVHCGTPWFWIARTQSDATTTATIGCNVSAHLATLENSFIALHTRDTEKDRARQQHFCRAKQCKLFHCHYHYHYHHTHLSE